jgi:H+/Cl- antiporter ClcA
MSSDRPLSRFPYFLLGGLTCASFGGPFVILVVVRGGASARWPPDRAVEWATIFVTCGLVATLFLACVTIGWWLRP